MNARLQELILEVGGNPTDPDWRCLVLNGPHGVDFTWGQSHRKPAGYVGVEHLEQIIDERCGNGPQRLSVIRRITYLALQSEDPEMVRRGIQILAVVGEPKDCDRIAAMRSHPDDRIAADARAASFYLKQRGPRT